MATSRFGLQKTEWDIWGRWMAAAIASWVIVGVAFCCIWIATYVAGYAYIDYRGWIEGEGAYGALLLALLGAGGAGAALAAGAILAFLYPGLQWVFLRKRLALSGRWVPNSAAGLLLSILILLLAVGSFALLSMSPLERKLDRLPDIAMSLASLFAGLVALALPGLTLGFAQWLVLRRQVLRAGWWVLISSLAWGIGGLLALIPLIGIPFFVLFPPAVTGLALVWLWRQPRLSAGRAQAAEVEASP